MMILRKKKNRQVAPDDDDDNDYEQEQNLEEETSPLNPPNFFTRSIESESELPPVRRAFAFGERLLSSDSLIESAMIEDDFEPLLPTLSRDERQERRAFKQTLSSIRNKIKSHRAAQYMIDFERDLEMMDNDTENNHNSAIAVSVCSIDVEELDKHRDAMAEDERIQRTNMETAHEKKMLHIDTVEQKSKQYFSLLSQNLDERNKEFRNEYNRRHGLYRQTLNKSFSEATSKMQTAIKKRRRGITETFGKFQANYDHLNYFSNLLLDCFKYSLKQKFYQQKITIRPRLIRGVKNKLPAGEYALFICLRDCIGGKMIGEHPVLDELLNTIMRKRRKTISSTDNQYILFKHDGKHNDLEIILPISNSMVTLTLPPPIDRKPYMVYSLEVIKVSGEHAGICVAWGSFPVDNPHFGLIEGKCKVPMIRGWMDAEIDQYWKMHKIYSKDLDLWIGNLYFEVDNSTERLSESNENGYELLEVVHDQRLWEDNEEDPLEEEEVLEDIEDPAVNDDELSMGSVYTDYIERDITSDEELVHYRYELKQLQGHKEFATSLNKSKFIAKAVVTDMGLSRPLSFAFIITIFLFLVAFWMRIYLHYFAQWAYLVAAVQIPGVLFEPGWIRVVLNYQATAVSLFHESAMVVAGVLFNYIILLFFIGCIWLFQYARINVPVFASKFVVAFGVMMILDPLLIFIVDCSYKNWASGDAFKLYQKFYRKDSSSSLDSAIWGILIVLSVYAWTTVLGCFTTYLFFFQIFMNGQLIDVYKRLYGNVHSFHIPNDLEVSYNELHYSIMKALRYRGEHGEVRRIIAMEYTLTDDYDPSFIEKTIHIILYTVFSQSREFRIYRQFLQYNDGTLIEIFKSEDAMRVLNSRAANVISEEKILQEIEKEEERREEIIQQNTVNITVRPN
jgi:hypothetical protein